MSRSFLPLYFHTLSQNPSCISRSFLPLYFHTLPQNPSFISISFLPLYFRTLSQNPSFISISFLPLHFRTLFQNPSFISISFYHYISVHCPKTRAKLGVPASYIYNLRGKLVIILKFALKLELFNSKDTPELESKRYLPTLKFA